MITGRQMDSRGEKDQRLGYGEKQTDQQLRMGDADGRRERQKQMDKWGADKGSNKDEIVSERGRNEGKQ